MREIELKLDCHPEMLHTILDIPALKIAEEPKIDHIETTYFDTERLDFAKTMVALRIRRKGGQWIQTLKVKRSEYAGLQDVEEFNAKLEQGEINWDVLPKLPLFEQVQHLREQVHAFFKTIFTRTSTILILHGQTRIELALDKGYIEHEGQKHAFCEVELELLDGEPKHLFELALRIHHAVPCQVSNLSKAERGYLMRKKLDILTPGNDLTSLPFIVKAWRECDRALRYKTPSPDPKQLWVILEALAGKLSLSQSEIAQKSLNSLIVELKQLLKLPDADLGEVHQLLQSPLYTETWLLCHQALLRTSILQ